MGFNSSSISFSRFRVLDPVSDEFLLAIPDKLRLFAFRDIDNTSDVRSFGWVPHEDMLDLAWENSHPRLGEYLLFSLRLDTRRISPAVIKKHVAQALREEYANMPEGQKLIPKNRKKEIIERISAVLLSRTLPVPALFDVLWNINKNEILFTSIQSKMIDLFMEYFTNSFNLHIEQILPSSLAQNFLDEKLQEELEQLQETQFI